mmetsp:Transcript_9694/g.14020  ORF Transcript_9694/g.14020 Transcript_9694/m.14020 type:complete len:148 (+) Transcript_9694:14-457(+)
MLGRTASAIRQSTARAAGLATSRTAGRSFSAPITKVVSPSEEFSGKTTMTVGKTAGRGAKSGVDTLHTYDDPIGFVDAPWTPKSFVGKTPQELVEEVPPIAVDGARVACDGGPNPAMGHPKVYLNLDQGKPKSCSYCGLRYFNAHHH